MNGLDKYLMTVFVTLIIFTTIMIVIFIIYQQTPDQLIQAFFATFGAETGFAGVIKVAKLITRRQNETGEEAEVSGEIDSEELGA